MKASFCGPRFWIVALLLILSRCATAQNSPNVTLDDLDPLKECKRRDVRLTEFNNKVYMYGGQSWFNNGTSKNFPVLNHYLRTVDFTTARDLNDSSILNAKDISIDVPIFMHGAFWSDSKKLYAVGGEVVSQPYLKEDGEWFDPDWPNLSGATVYSYDIDADEWSSEPAVQPDSGSSVRMTFCCGSFGWNSQSRKVYFFSGSDWAGARKHDPTSGNNVLGPMPDDVVGNGNLLSFDTPNFKWSNTTTDNKLTTSWTEFGEIVSLPGTESSSGGVSIALGGIRKLPTESMESLRQVLVYDSGTGTWYAQPTTAEGDKFPPSRMNFCAVSASAPDNSSHNIYVYGGEGPDAKPQAWSDMYILSIPSFHWISVDVSSVPRKSIACTKVAGRYMVTYGGVPGGYGYTGDDDDCDQENYGLRLFDLSDLSWKSRYEGPASENNAYTVPSIVYKAIGGNEKGGATQTAPSAGFSTPGLQSVFQKSGSTSPTSPNSDDDGDNGDNGNSKKSNTGAIAGGVVGGVAGLAIIVTGIFFFLKRRKARKNAAAELGPEETHYGPTYGGELPENASDRKPGVYEIYGRQTSSTPQELEAGETLQSQTITTEIPK